MTKFIHKFRRWILGWIDLGEAIIIILTFASWYPGWSFTLMAKICIKETQERIQRLARERK